MNRHLQVDPGTLTLLPCSNSSDYKKSCLPKCPNCATGLARPNVYLFGDGDRFVDRADVSGKDAFEEFKEEVMQSSATRPMFVSLF